MYPEWANGTCVLGMLRQSGTDTLVVLRQANDELEDKGRLPDWRRGVVYTGERLAIVLHDCEAEGSVVSCEDLSRTIESCREL